jgi:hypothetical protein
MGTVNKFIIVDLESKFTNEVEYSLEIPSELILDFLIAMNFDPKADFNIGMKIKDTDGNLLRTVI